MIKIDTYTHFFLKKLDKKKSEGGMWGKAEN